MDRNRVYAKTPAQVLVETVVHEIKSKGLQLNRYNLEREQVYYLLTSTFESGLYWLSDSEKNNLTDYVYREMVAKEKPKREKVLNQDEVDFIFDMIQADNM